MSVPDLIQPLVGYRLWVVQHGLLTSAMFHLPEMLLTWSPGQNTSECYIRSMARERLKFWERQHQQADEEERPWNKHARDAWYKQMYAEKQRWHTLMNLPNHTPPHPDCQCGLYAYQSLEYAYERYRRRELPRPKHASVALGAVELWGAIELYDQGMRAQYARPIALVEAIDDTDVDSLAASYQVPVLDKQALQTLQNNNI